MPGQLASSPTIVGIATNTSVTKPHALVTVGIPSAISLTQAIVKSAGQVIVGPSFSILNVCVHSAVLPHSSVAV